MHFCEFQNILLSSEIINRIKELESNTHKKYRKFYPIEIKKVSRIIQYIKNTKLKLCYQTMISTGLRVSELASITTKDCTITDNEITFSFLGKGSKKGTVRLLSVDYPKLYLKIKELLENTKENKKLFYSAIYLQINAKSLGFKCHDLRRIFAVLEYKKHNSKADIMRKLRHSNIKTTNIYLNSKIKF